MDRAVNRLKRYLGSLPRGTELHTIKSELNLQGFRFEAVEMGQLSQVFDVYYEESDDSTLAADLHFDSASRFLEANFHL